MIVLGIDPGSLVTGYGLIRADRHDIKHIENGSIRLGSKRSLPERLGAVHQRVAELIQRHRPDIMALENIFVARNAKSAMILGHARGAVMLTAFREGIDVKEYSATQVKQALVGNGAATKHQVQQMTRVLLGLQKVAEEDAADALAVAICHCQSYRLQQNIARSLKR